MVGEPHCCIEKSFWKVEMIVNVGRYYRIASYVCRCYADQEKPELEKAYAAIVHHKTVAKLERSATSGIPISRDK